MQFSTKTPLTDLQKRLIDKTAEVAAFDGWTDTALRQAAEELEIDPAVAFDIFHHRPIDLILAHSCLGDERLIEATSGHEWFENQKVRDKIKSLIMKRFDQHQHEREAIRRGLSVLALPQYAPAASKALYRTVDAMWRVAGDTATDYNKHTKRLLLSGVYSSSLLVWLNDQSEDLATTEAFVRRRIDNVLFVFGKIGKVRDGVKSGLRGDLRPSSFVPSFFKPPFVRPRSDETPQGPQGPQGESPS